MNRLLKVLHVDDDPEMLALSAAAFRQLDAVSFLTVETTTEALDVIAAEPVDCVVSDSLVPPNGMSFIKVVRQEHADILIPLFTTREWPEVVNVVSTAGVIEYVQKAGPGDLATVLRHVRGIVDDDSANSALAVGISVVTQALEDHADATAEATFSLDDNWELVGQWLGDEKLGIVIVEAVESCSGSSAIETPLYEYIGTDALEELLRPTVEDEECPGVEVRFPYEDVQIAVMSTGDIFARSMPEHTLS